MVAINNPTTFKHTMPCCQCRKRVTVAVPKEGFLRWRSGEHIQHAFPELSEGEREFLISGICESCFDSLWHQCKMLADMIVMPANNSNAHKLEEEFPGRLGLLLGPSGWRQPRKLTYACDNDCFPVWSRGRPWRETAWWAMLEKVASCESSPRWIAIPDVVGDAFATQRRWAKFAPLVVERFGFPLALVAQDGMTPDSVAEFLLSQVKPTVIFVGGSTDWKRRTLWHWCHSFPRVHVGRVNTEKWLWNAHRCGAESVDGTGFFRGGDQRSAGLLRYLRKSSQGVSTNQLELGFAECDEYEEA